MILFSVYRTFETIYWGYISVTAHRTPCCKVNHIVEPEMVLSFLIKFLLHRKTFKMKGVNFNALVILLEMTIFCAITRFKVAAK